MNRLPRFHWAAIAAWAGIASHLGRAEDRRPGLCAQDFALEINYLNGQYWLVYSVNYNTARHTFGIVLLHADRPEVPYQKMSPDKPFSEGFDPSLFRDDDGKVYMLRNGSLITRLKDDLSGLAKPYRQIAAANFPCVGNESPCRFKNHDRHTSRRQEKLRRDGRFGE